jgi:hypothetical protein
MPNSIVEKIEKEIAANRRRMMTELDARCTYAINACSNDNSPENWRLYEQALHEYYRAYVNQGADDMFELLNFSSSRKVRRSAQSRKSISSSL